MSMVEEEEEDLGGVIYRRRRLSSVKSRKQWIVDDDDDEELIKKNGSSVFAIDPPDVLDCPICLHPLFTPVFQCDNGHIACSSCRSKLNNTKCPFCCTPIAIRCRGLENFIQSITSISCIYAKYGCKHTMPYPHRTLHEQTCPHAPSNCPHPSCSFAASYNNLHLHFHIQHSTTRFTFNTPFSLGVQQIHSRIFLQETHTHAVFILNHHVKQDHGRAFSIHYLGPATSNSSFLYQLTAKTITGSLSLISHPGIYTQWSTHTPQTNNYLNVPSGFEGHAPAGLLSLSVCISSDLALEAQQTQEEEVSGNEEDDGDTNGALQVVMTDPGVLDCSICHQPLRIPVFQCQNGHLACCLCCSKVETICPICYPLGYKFNRCRGLEAAIESISRISCCKETMTAYNNRESEPEETCHPHSFRKDDNELISIADLELESLMYEEEVDEDELEIDGKNHQQHTTNNENEAVQVVLDDRYILDCFICSSLLVPPVFQCEIGHLACFQCCSELKGRCLCCMPNNNRCRAFEKFIESISSISCKNAVLGCRKKVPYSNKSKHEQSCPYTTCWCPYPSCSFSGSFKSLYFHFGFKHTTSTARFTYDTTFYICIEIDQTTVFLQEQNENVIFVLNHEVREHERALNIDCVGVGYFKSCFMYQLTAKNMETCLLLRSVPEMYTRWSNDTPRKCNLTIPSGFADYDGLLTLSVCIKKKVVPSEFEEEMKEVSIELNHKLDARPKVTVTNPDIFYCSICFTPLCSRVFQCEKGHLSCSSCCSKMKKVCPFCYTSTGCYNYNRCEGVENLFRSVIVPCKNDGCGMAMLLRYQNEHEEMCPHATCFCPYPSCPFTGSHESLYLHFGIKHEADITRFTYGTTFYLCVDINQEYLFLQERQANVIFILNHQVQLHERVMCIDCVGTTILESKFVCQVTARSMETSRTLEPQIYAKWSKHNNIPLDDEDYYLAVPSEFAGYNGHLSLSVCITKYR